MLLWQFKKIYYRFVQLLTKKFTEILKFKNPQLKIGTGSIIHLEEMMRDKKVKKALFIASQRIMDSGILDELIEKFKENDINYVTYHNVMPNPTIKNVEEALDIYRKNHCDCLVTIGGGSQIDCAKLVAARAANPNLHVRQLRGLFKVRKPLSPLFVVPTTAGSGSEATIAAVVSDSETHEKFAVVDPKLMPAAAILDPELTITLPPDLTATTGMDALTHAIEAYIGNNGTKYTNEKSIEAIKLIFGNLEAAYQDGKNLEARKNMLVASYYAGLAFTRANVGYVHAISHSLGGRYNIAHGLSNAIILPYILEYYGNHAYKKLAEISKALGIDQSSSAVTGRNASDEVLAKRLISKIKEMNKNMNIPLKINALNVNDIPLIAKTALKEANPAYPVPKIMNYAECTAIIRKLI